MVVLQALLHAVVAIEFDKACPHELVVLLVCAHTNFGRLDLCKVLLDLLLGRSKGQVSWFGKP
jgi:hypothetical protein